MNRWTAILMMLPLALAMAVLPARSQQSNGGSLDEFYTYGDTYFLEAITMPGSSATKARVMINFRFSYDLLTFRRTQFAYQKGNLYEAPATMYVEAVGSDGVIGDRAIWYDTVRVQDYALTNAKRLFLPGTVDLALRPGVYTIRYMVGDGTPGTGFSETLGPLKVTDFHSPSPAIGTPLFLRSATGDTLLAATIDASAPFGQPIRAFVPLASAERPKALRYELWTSVKSKDSFPRLLNAGDGKLLPYTVLGAPIPTGENFRFVLRHGIDTGASPRAHAAMIEIPADDLSIADYLMLLTYEAGANSVTDSIRFSIKWEDMPLSLTRADYAIRALYPIAVDDTIQALLDAGKEEQRRVALDRFWLQRDPTPGTRYNEAMAEYYRRVDYAFFNFKNLGQRDGVYTDRGKIYILYGPPTDVGREMIPDVSPREIWTYGNRVGKKFVFLDDSRIGEYRLVEYYDL